MKRQVNVKMIRTFKKVSEARECKHKYSKRQIRRLSKMKKVIGKFVGDINKAHRNAKNSKLVFKSSPRFVA